MEGRLLTSPLLYMVITMKYNRICVNCGDKYYVCNQCTSINSWKNICCSRECYKQAMSSDNIYFPQKINEGGENMTLIRGGLISGRTVDIHGYDLELGRFDCSDGVTRQFNDFEYFILPKSEMKEIADKISKLNENKNRNIRSQSKTRRNNNNQQEL